ncbi:SDR family oxidoreductase [Inhella crocodyli]|uniref:SDR family oxidoreductase n=1 Tax=Inhella crocodyli TaxID=2499851 RepID=A0A437LTF2_9BURK|nr:SDR family oxidoreductase [Inhella crocodyli]RVT88678.1 SDR family oxidoreductase [Inhella crocodyli]
MHLLVIGASRGIGLEFVKQYRAEGHQVTATARDEASLIRLRDLGAKPVRLDVLDPGSCAGLAWQLDGLQFDIAIVNAGVYGPHVDAPTAPSQDDFDFVMRTNVLGPMRVLPALTETLAQGAKLAVISSKMGSMALRASPNGWLYRASKAAVNSVLKDASIVLGGRATCVAFHPGWVRTDMGGPQADLSPADAVAAMRRTLVGLGAGDNGSYLNFDGQPLAW